MKYIILIVLLISAQQFVAQDPFVKIEAKQEKLEYLNLTEIKPTGWLKEQMRKDMNGFVGHLDIIVPDLIANDDIYGKDRLTKGVKTKDLGNNPEGEEWEVQFLWWNSETQSNWRDGYVRNAYFLNDRQHIEKIEEYVKHILATQDEDGYIGIYEPDLRYKFNSDINENGENGELWAKASLFRVLLAYYGFTNDRKVLVAIERAVQNVMDNYKINESKPFEVVFPSAGLCHGLVFTDVLDQLYKLTGKQEYWDYALFLYKDYSMHKMSEEDIQYYHVIDPEYKLRGHGVHTYEHIRPLLVAGYASGNPNLEKALQMYLDKIKNVTTFTGGAIGDEWIFGREADPTDIGYEYCSLHELLDSYGHLVQKTGDVSYADIIENIFFNAALGARHPEKSSIAYLKTDNSYEMTGTRNGCDDHNHKQTRYKYSPAHQDAAVCCVPNAGRIIPYYLQNMWLKDNEGIIASLFGSSEVNTKINGKQVFIKEITEYPYSNVIRFEIEAPEATEFALKIRKPLWATDIKINAKYTEEDNFIVIRKAWKGKDVVEVEFKAEVQQHQTSSGEVYFSYAGQILALPIDAIEIPEKIYTNEFMDFAYKPQHLVKYQYINKKPARKGDCFVVKLYNPESGKNEKKELLHIGKTILRQASFKPQNN